MDKEIEIRYADLAVAAHVLIREAMPFLSLLRKTPIYRHLMNLQTALEQSLTDVAPLIKDNPRYKGGGAALARADDDTQGGTHDV